MRYLILLFILGCGTVKPTPQPIPVPVHVTKVDTTYIHITKRDTQTITLFNVDTVKHLSFSDFGAAGDGNHDDADAITFACNYVIAHPQTLIAPIGNFYISHPILLQNNGRFFTIHIAGMLSNKSSSNEYLSKITYGGKSGYAFGIQLGRSVVIENITIIGQYTFPNNVTNANIGILKFSDWVDPSITDTRNSPYAAIVIDPNQNANGGTGGTSDVTIQNCAFKYWMVGICLSPNGTLNDEMINILEDDIEACRVAIAIGQDQSKTINIKGLKVWASCHTILDGITYGRGTGGGSVFCENWNIAGNCNELFNLYTDRFPLSCKDIYSESLFRIGNVGAGTGANFINTQIDFLTGPGMPEADYLIAGQANFYGGMLRYYDNDITHRMNLSNLGGAYRDMVFNTIPFTANLFGGINYTPAPVFDNVNLYYYNGGGGKKLVAPYEIYIPLRCNISFNKDWTAKLYRYDTPLPQMQVGDYILGASASAYRKCYDPYLNPQNITTVQIGRVVAITGDTIRLDRVGLNAPNIGYDAIYISRMQ